MARSDRLLRLLHALRVLPAPVTAARLAAETGVSLRTLYRDVAALRASGARIEGAAGYGYTLREDPALPPQMFDQLEVEALVLGMAEVAQWGDPALAEAARSALAKIVARVPSRVQRQALHAVSQVHRFAPRPAAPSFMGLIRQACWDEEALDIQYSDAQGLPSQRRIWPLATVWFESGQMLLAWCCLRQNFRMFMFQRIAAVVLAGEGFRPRRVPLLRQYVQQLER